MKTEIEIELLNVTDEQAIKLKKLKFDSWTSTAIHINGDFLNMPHNNKIEFREDMVAMPKVALAIKWLREKKQIYIDVKRSSKLSWVEVSDDTTMKILTPLTMKYHNHNEAESAGLDFALDFLLNSAG